MTSMVANKVGGILVYCRHSLRQVPLQRYKKYQSVLGTFASWVCKQEARGKYGPDENDVGEVFATQDEWLAWNY